MDPDKPAYEPGDAEREPLHLPFEPRKRDWAEWIYDHRAGVLVTVIVYLVLAIAVVTARIVIRPSEPVSAFYMDVQSMEELIEEKARLEEHVRQLQMQQQWERESFEQLRNRVSNEEGELNSGLRDARGTSAEQIYDEARALEESLRASREAYERGLRSAERILNERPAQDNGGNEAHTRREEGPVSISYSLPGRHATYLYPPTYQCLNEGEITVNIVVNRNGQVTDVSVAGGSSADTCLRDFAVRAAKASTFNVDGNANNRQTGTITYKFAAQ